jgi:hypothetical protein
MKNKVLSFAIALIALFAFNTAQAQKAANPHLTDIVVSEDGMTVTGKVAGLGKFYTGQQIHIALNTTVEVDMVCEAASGNGQATNAGKAIKNATASTMTFVDGKNGHVKFTLTLDAPEFQNAECPGRLIEGAINGYDITGGTVTFTLGDLTGSYTW